MPGQDKQKMRPKEPRPEWAVLLDSKALMDFIEVEKILSVGPQTILEYVSDGKLTLHKLPGGEDRITTTSIKTFLRSYRLKPDSFSQIKDFNKDQITSQDIPDDTNYKDKGWLLIGIASRKSGWDRQTLKRWAIDEKIDGRKLPNGYWIVRYKSIAEFLDGPGRQLENLQ